MIKQTLTRFGCLLLITMLHFSGKGQSSDDGIFFSSLNYSVRLGQLEGTATLKELKQHGDFGVGGENGLASEMVFLNGVAYRFPANGNAGLMPDTAKLGFAAVKFFKAENKWTVNKPTPMQQLQLFMDSVINTNLFSAIKVTGSFVSVKYKCYVAQQKPYMPVTRAPVKFFDSTHIQGTMVGFFTPKAAMVMNPNYHFHFINSKATSGGHVDDYVVENVTIEVDYADELHVKLPTAEAMKDINFNKLLTPF